MPVRPKMPFNFGFFYEPETDDSLKNILLIEDASQVKPLHLKITNNLTGKEITIPASVSDDPVTETNYHFKLVLNPGVLVEPGDITLQGSEWRLQHASEAGGAKDSLYLCLTGEDIILRQDDSLELIFNGVAATDILSSSTQQAQLRKKGTSVELSWIMDSLQVATPSENEEYEGQQKEALTITPRLPGQGDEYEDHETINLDIVQGKGKPNIPLAVGFAGSNRVLNIDDQLSALQLRITNTSDPDNENSTITFHYDSNPTQCSQLAVALEVGDAANAPWAIGTQDDVNTITVSPTESDKWRSTSDTPERITIGGVVRALQWTFSPNSADVSLAAQETLTIDISKIKTAHPTGATKLYLRYNYVPEYQDGEFVCAIEKAPLVFYGYKEKNPTPPPAEKIFPYVGIGTTEPKDRLHIRGGNLRLESTNSAGETDAAIQSSRHIILRSDVDKTIDTDSVKFFHQDQTTPLMVLSADGKLGIGIAKPEAKLHVTETIKAKNVEVVETVSANKLQGDGAVLTGMIVMWSGPADKVPEGWALCNGDNRTPDLRGRFVVGAVLDSQAQGDYADYKVGNSGGQKQVTLTEEQMPKHAHGIKDPGHTHTTNIYSQTGDSDDADDRDVRVPDNVIIESSNNTTGITILETGQGKPYDNRPPYYALCFIIKVDLK